ncbi:MAG TPA: hypothetical protein VL306_01480 [Methylomirabilota bacterium]|nr:hypothetical protein [Methylomirabilota bacterium]
MRLEQSPVSTEHVDQNRPEFFQENLALELFQAIPQLETRVSTKEEDSGRIDIGPKQIIDAVSYLEKKPAMALQITSSSSREVRAKKLQEMRTKPFIRLPEMKPSEPAIPRVLVYLDKQYLAQIESGSLRNNPEAAIQVLSSAINSLKFDLTQTKNPLEQKSVQGLIQILEQEKRKYIH